VPRPCMHVAHLDVVLICVHLCACRSEVEETLKRISSHKGVQGIVIVNSEGIPIRSTMENSTTTQYAANLSQLAAKSRSVVRDLDPQNDLTFLRIRTKKHEMMIAPDKDFMLVVVQNPNSEDQVAR